MLEQPTPEEMDQEERTHAGAVLEKLQPLRTHTGAVHKGESSVGGTPHWNSGIV